MAITTYAELLTAVQRWLKPNTTLEQPEIDLMADYVALAESNFNRVLFHGFMEVEATLTITNGVASVPADLLNVILIQMTQSPYNEITPSQAPLLAATAGYATGKAPDEYKWSGDDFKFNSPMSVSAAIRYRRTIPALSISNTTNWLLTRFPDMYLFQSVLHGDTRLLDDEQMKVVNGMYEKSLAEFTDWSRLAHMGTYKARPSAGVA